jgi:rhamnulokinase
MTKKLEVLSFDLGAKSGRAIIGEYDGDKLNIHEVHRFLNGPVSMGNHLYWDILYIYGEVKRGMQKAVLSSKGRISSMGIDSWGVDYGLIDEVGDLISNPFHYRDQRTQGIMEEAFSILSKDEIFNETGIQFMMINTLYQLIATAYEKPYLLENAQTLLLIPDLLNYFLTGVKATEYTNASTTQLLDAFDRDWSKKILDAFQFPPYLFIEISSPGTTLGHLSKGLCDQLHLYPIPVISVGSHDTASAVAALPYMGKGEHAYISCGTWSLMGVEISYPIINDKSKELNFTNEGGVCGTYRFLKNIMGLWLLQECKREWGGEVLDYQELTYEASCYAPLKYFIDPDDESFLFPYNMPDKVRDYCRRTGQDNPIERGAVVSTILQSLALKYRHTLENIEDIIGKRIDAIHMVGGGVNNKLLCQFTANAVARPVIAGPSEASAIGNILLQLIALGEIRDIEEGRALVRRSCSPEIYEPQESTRWQQGYEEFLKVTQL